MQDHQNCHVEPIEKSFDPAALEGAMQAHFAIQGMGCERCAMRVHNGLLELEGVFTAAISLESADAVVTFDPRRVKVENLIVAVGRAGNNSHHTYRAHLIQQFPAAG